MQNTYNITPSSIYPLGVRFMPEGLHISLVCKDREECGIVLFDKKHKDGIKVPFPKEYRKGNVYSMLLKGYQDRTCSYLFYHGEEVYQDPYTRALENNRKYGTVTSQPAHCKILDNNYDWENDKPLSIPFEDSIFYMLHVRGFTKHRTSGVRCKGTYAGVVEKIPYLKELGITAVLLMPSYEFDEVFHEDKQYMSIEEAAAAYKDIQKPESEQESKPVRINYWGYQEGFYFLPKYAYSYTKDAITEFKDMVKALHQNGIEVMMQFYLPPELNYVKILEILNYWILEYHIDGFQLMGMNIPIQMLCKEPLFAETKIIGERDCCLLPSKEKAGDSTDDIYCNFGYMNDSFLYDIRKLLKSDANMIETFIYLCRNNSADKGIINYIAKQDGFRLADLVSYNCKHNEANGENNQDGVVDNYSWNCGAEGKTRKKSILNLRMKQMKNAMTFVLLSQGTPLIYSGDEFGNSQEGNNNPYCQDNSICWIKWNMLKTNEELFNYTKELIALRKRHKILHSKTPLMGIDYISCGYPDISFHGREAWKPDINPESRSLGILYCGRYGNYPDEIDDSFIYIGVNMHWSPCVFGLPKMPKGMEWSKLFSTALAEPDKEEDTTQDPEDIQNIKIPPRTIIIYGAKKNVKNSETPSKLPNKRSNKAVRKLKNSDKNEKA